MFINRAVYDRVVNLYHVTIGKFKCPCVTYFISYKLQRTRMLRVWALNQTLIFRPATYIKEVGLLLLGLPQSIGYNLIRVYLTKCSQCVTKGYFLSRYFDGCHDFIS